MKADNLSVRQFLRSYGPTRRIDATHVLTEVRTTNPSPLPNGPGYNFNTIEWLETFTL